MQKLVLYSTLFLLGIYLTSCYNNKEEEVYPTIKSGCDTLVTMTYSTHVAPLLKSKCTTCHGGSSPSAGIGLDTYEGVKKVADNGKLYGAINHSPSYQPMPKGGDKIVFCQIRQIKIWIDKGALNN